MSSKSCPRCREPLKAAKGPGMTLDVCGNCGGVHFDHGELAQMTIKRRDELDDVELLVELDGPPPTQTHSHGLRCSNCATAMETYDYAACSGIKLDRCPDCFAVWVDDGELAAIQAHLDAGQARTRPKPQVADNEDTAIAMAQMDARIHQSQARLKAIHTFMGCNSIGRWMRLI